MLSSLLALVLTLLDDHLRRIDLTRPFTVTKIDTVQEESIPLSTQVPRLSSGTMWARNAAIYLGPGDPEVYPLLVNGTWRNQTTTALIKDIWTYDTADPDSGWIRLPLMRDQDSLNALKIITGGSVAYLDGMAYIMGGGGATNLPVDWKNPNGTLIAPSREDREIKLETLFKLDLEKKVIRNETSSLGPVISGRMVSIGSGKGE